MYRILICGDREWDNIHAIKRELLNIGLENIEVIIEGEARGADKQSKEVALELGFPDERILKFPADWGQYKKAAGPIRNRKQFHEGKPNLVLAFHANIGGSSGTIDMIKVANRGGVEVRIFAQ